jgi:hypothetical protein
MFFGEAKWRFLGDGLIRGLLNIYPEHNATYENLSRNLQTQRLNPEHLKFAAGNLDAFHDGSTKKKRKTAVPEWLHIMPALGN